ncbi:hypothetical protein HAX54_025348 [Datura stramonium]|uniref:Uncharacterized protein n=1 Tax=Datura stramonium TaxID=4076 RepID=A0ABS8S690_DATST|nr:hypothetical protein [Datura stramonium]
MTSMLSAVGWSDMEVGKNPLSTTQFPPLPRTQDSMHKNSLESPSTKLNFEEISRMVDEMKEDELQQEKFDGGPSNKSKQAQNYGETREGSLSISSSPGGGSTSTESNHKKWGDRVEEEAEEELFEERLQMEVMIVHTQEHEM